MSALAPLTGMPVAFKLGTALGVFLLPLLAYASLRLMRLPFPAPLVGAAASLVFLFLEDNPIWGGTIASTLTGEFSYTYGVGFAVLFLGVLFRARADGRGPWAPAAVLALTCYAHGYAVLWAGLTASGLLLWDPRPGGGPGRATWRTLGWLAAVAALAFALAGARPRAPPRGLGLDDALRRRVDHDHDAGALPRAPLAALPRRGRRARGAARAPPGEAPGRAPAPARLRRARRRRAGRGRARASGSWTCASCPSRSSRSPSPARRASGSPSPAWPSPTWRPSASSWSPRPTPTRARSCCATGSTGTTRASRRRSCGPRGRSSTPGCGAGPPTRGWPSSTARCTSGRARSACTRWCRSSPAARASRASTASRARPRTPSTTSCPSSSPPRRTRSAAGATRASTSRAASRGCRLFGVEPDRGDEPRPRRGARRPARGRAGGAHSSVHALPPRGPRSRRSWSRWPSRRCARRLEAGATRRTAGSPASPRTAPCSCSRRTRASTSWRPTPGRRRPSARCPAGSRRRRRSRRRRSASRRAGRATRSSSRSPTTRAGGPRAPPVPTSPRPASC